MIQKATTERSLNVGILGAGITGLTAAFYLLRAGHRVTVLEARPQVGGLATSFNFGPFHWDKFYHCILTSDGPLLQLLRDLGLEPEMRWTQTKVGFYTGDGFHSMTSTADFIKFPALSLWEKFRLGLGVLRASRIREGKELESIPIRDWLVQIFGKGNYEKMWEPLLKCKLGDCRSEASAAFIWATISRLYSTREKGASQKECLGYVRGGYRTVFGRLLDEIEKQGGTVRTGVPVEKIDATPSGIAVHSGQERLCFDTVISTAPSHIVDKVAPTLDSDYRRRLREVKYLGMVCVVLVLKRGLTPFYTTNITEDVPFTGVIEMTNLISGDETAGRHLVYLPKYTAPNDPLFEMPDEQVWAIFQGPLRRMFPDLQDREIEMKFVFREKLVQPLPVLRYSDIAPPMETSIPGFLVANTTQIFNSTLNNNEMVKIARKAVAKAESSAASR